MDALERQSDKLSKTILNSSTSDSVYGNRRRRKCDGGELLQTSLAGVVVAVVVVIVVILGLNNAEPDCHDDDDDGNDGHYFELVHYFEDEDARETYQRYPGKSTSSSVSCGRC